MNASTYRDMHLLNELTHSPDASQRELARRIGVALGLANLMLRRLVKKGYVKISGTKRSRIRYLITPQGILEKSRLAYEFIDHSLRFYSRIRRSLREQLAMLAQTGHRKILLCGTGELAEIAFLTIREMGLEFVGVVDESPGYERFLGYPAQPLSAIPALTYDRIVVASLRNEEQGIQRLIAMGVTMERMIFLPIPALQHILLDGVSLGATEAPPPVPTIEAATRIVEV